MDALRRIGEALGGPDFAQGPGGNVSVKRGDMLLVKASGRRLRDLGKPDAHAEVPLADALLALGGDAAADARVFGRTPRPSLETYFHALGGTVVAHTHALGALLVACSRAARPSGMLSVSYERPGVGLARAVHAVLGEAREAVVLLESHGLLVYAENAEDAITRTLEIDRACRRAVPELSSFTDMLAAQPEPEALEEGGVFVHLPRRVVPRPRYLFPDVVVYGSVVKVPALTDARAMSAEALRTFGRPVVLVGDDGARVQCARTADELSQAREVALAHDFVEDALAARGDAVYLADDEPEKIVSLPSEQYRLALTRKASSC